MSFCLHHNLVLLPAAGKRVRCRHCHLTIDPKELGDNHCPECYEVHGEKRSDFETIEDGQKVISANHTWTIVGTVPAGVVTRVFMPLRTAQYLFGDSIQRCTLMFVKLKDGRSVGPAAAAIKKTTGQDVMPLTAYRGMLQSKFDLMFGYVDMVNGVALSIAFLFIMITLYTMVLQRNRDIAILKSSGASWWCITRQVISESALLTMGGTVLGIGLAFAAGWLIGRIKPLYTVEITPKWILIAFGAAAIGATVSSIYPAWRAARVDMSEVLAQD